VSKDPDWAKKMAEELKRKMQEAADRAKYEAEKM